MDFGIGFSETILIVFLVLIFFGSNQVPTILKEIGRFTALLRARFNEFYSQIQIPDKPAESFIPTEVIKKKELRKTYNDLRKALSPEDVQHKSGLVFTRLTEHVLWRSANAVMIYLSLPYEVQTDAMINLAFSQQKRVMVPYVDETKNRINISEIKNIHDLQPGHFKVREPKKEDIKRFFKSDLELVICPGVAFDRNCSRLGFGKGYYDMFLKELRGDVPMVGLSFDLQITPERIPFSYDDIPMDFIFTESQTLDRVGG